MIHLTSGRRVGGAVLAVSLAACVACSGSSSKKPTPTTITNPSTTTAVTTTVVPTTTVPVTLAPVTSKTTTTTTTKPHTTTTVAGPPTTVLTVANNGQTITGVVGETFEVELVACEASCGYRWVVTGIPSPVVLTDEGETDTPTTPTTVSSVPETGGSTTQIFTFKAVGAHTTGLIIGYFPPGSNQASQTFQVTFTIKS